MHPFNGTFTFHVCRSIIKNNGTPYRFILQNSSFGFSSVSETEKYLRPSFWQQENSHWCVRLCGTFLQDVPVYMLRTLVNGDVEECGHLGQKTEFSKFYGVREVKTISQVSNEIYKSKIQTFNYPRTKQCMFCVNLITFYLFWWTTRKGIRSGPRVKTG